MTDRVSPKRAPAPLAPLLAVVFISTLGFSIVLPFLVFLVIRLGGNPVVYGLIGATYSAFQLVGAPILGGWSDRHGRRRVLVLTQLGTFLAWCLFLAAITVPVTVIAQVQTALFGAFTLTVPLLLLFAARAVDGLTGGNVSVANAYVADVTSEENRSASFGKMAVAQNLGFITGPAVAGLLGGGTRWGETAPVAAAMLVSFVGLVVIVAWLPEPQRCRWVDRPQRRSVRKVLGQEARDCHEVRGADRMRLGEVLRLSGVGLLLAGTGRRAPCRASPAASAPLRASSVCWPEARSTRRWGLPSSRSRRPWR
jgi:MFS family permease